MNAKHENKRWPWAALVLSFALTACYEPKEGCLDASATNFELDADKACTGCCVYPSLKLTLQHRMVYGDTSVNLVFLDSIYYDEGGHPFRISGIRFYLSNLQLVRADGTAVGIEETVPVTVVLPDNSTEMITVEDNFLLVNAGFTPSLTVGTFKKDGAFTKIRFTLGIEGQVNRADPTAFADDHPLAPQDDPMHWSIDSGYVFNQFRFLRDTTAADTIPAVVEIGMPAQLRTVELDIPAGYAVTEGFSTAITLRIDYRQWLAGISNIKTATLAELAEKIVNNVPQSISVIDIKKG
jgi:hypothetical protein